MNAAPAPGVAGRTAVAELLDSIAGAIDRRSDAGWPDTDRARAALAAARADHLPVGATGETIGPAGSPAATIDDRLRDIARHAGLREAETRILTAAFAAEIDPNLHLLTGLLSGDDGPARPTVAAALEIAGLAPASAAARGHLAELAPLRRHRLLHLPGDAVLHARRAVLSDRVAAHLLGDDMPSAATLPLLIDAAPLAIAGTDTLVAALRAGHELVWVHGAPGAAGTAMAAAACRELGVPCLLADLHRLPSGDPATPVPPPAALRAALDALLTEALVSGCVLILAGAELVAPQTDRLAHPALPVIAVGAVPWDPAWAPVRLPISVTATRASIAARSALWRPVLRGGSPDAQIAALRLTPEEIDRVARLAADTGALGGTGDGVSDVTAGTGDGNDTPGAHAFGPAAIRHATRRLGRNRSTASGRSTEPAGMDDLILPDHTKREVARLLDWARYRDEVLAQGPLQGKGGKGSGICALFAGSPGTGKSLAAHVVADTLGMDLYGVDISSMVDKYVGETEKNLERVFTEAESLNAVLFFDEADSLFGARSEVRDAHDRYANQEVAYLLQRMEQFDGITILATNLRGNLDPAFTRRLHFVIHFPDPDEMTKRQLWRYHLSHLRGTDVDDPVDIDALAHSLDLAGGDIRNVVLSAAYQAASEQAAVGMRHIVAATHREYTKLGRRVPAQQFPVAPQQMG